MAGKMLYVGVDDAPNSTAVVWRYDPPRRGLSSVEFKVIVPPKGESLYGTAYRVFEVFDQMPTDRLIIACVERPLKSPIKNNKSWGDHREFFGMIYALLMVDVRPYIRVYSCYPDETKEAVNAAASADKDTMIRAVSRLGWPEILTVNLNVRARTDCADGYALSLEAERQFRAEKILNGGSK